MGIFEIIVLLLSCQQAVNYNSSPSSSNLSQECSHLYLLNIQPYPDNKPFASWDRGLDLIPGGHLAAEQINNNSNILPEYQLKIIDIDSEACGRNTINKGLVNFYRELVVSKKPCIVGVTGMICSAQTNVFAPLAGHPSIGYIQNALSISPPHRNTSEYPCLFHTISSSSVFNKAAIAMMKAFNWRRIGLVHDSLGFYPRNTANDFYDRIQQSYAGAEIITRIPIENSHRIFPEIFKIVNDQEVRINYWVVSHDQGAFSLCEAYKRRLFWPGYVYIMRFLDLNNLLHASTKTTCNEEEILAALEGVFLLEYRLSVDDSTKLYSGWSYSEFRQRYVEKLWQYAENRSDHVQENLHANTLYDQVWMFALAINASLSTIVSQKLSFENYVIGNTKRITDILKSELKKLSFQGASGWIQFNELQEVPSFIDIFQFRNGSPVEIGVYDPFIQNVSFNIENYPDYIPRDTFDTFYNLLPSWLGVLMFTAQVILFCFISVNTVLIILWKEESEIKASSPILSMLIIIGCYLHCISPAVTVVSRMFMLKNTDLLESLCYVSFWSESIGLDLIFATLFLRLLRVHHIFKLFQQISKYWLDKYLFIYALLICMGKVCLLVLQASVDHLHLEIQREYVSSAIPPYYKATLHCTSSAHSLWVLLSFLYSAVLLLLVLFLAIQTRHVHKDNFKDTKKVNFFIFLVVVVLAITISLEVVFIEAGIDIGADILEWLAYFAVAMICQFCLFVPKTVPLFVNKFIYERNNGNVKQKSQSTNTATL